MKVWIDKIYSSQLELEDALTLEATMDEIKDDVDGRRLVRYLKKRRGAIAFALNILDKF